MTGGSPRRSSGLRAEIDALGPWFHNLHLPDGTQTAPDHPYGDFPRFKWDKVRSSLPEDLHGWSVLDVGCNGGFYSIELARRGASVLSIDADPLYLNQARWAARRWGLEGRIDFRQGDVYRLLDLERRFDLVWFTGVLYHLRYPLLALDVVRRVTERLLMFQTMTMPGTATVDVPHDLSLDDRDTLLAPGWPRMAFIEHALAGDPTNWWVPDAACVKAMLRSAGFGVTRCPEHEFYLCEPRSFWETDDFRRVILGERVLPGKRPHTG